MYKEQVKFEAGKAKNNASKSSVEVTNKSQTPDGFTRKYSEAAKSFSESPTKIEEKLDDKLNNFMKGLQENISKQLSDFSKVLQTNMIEMKTELEKSISKQIVDNNVRVCKFFIDLIKLVIPSCDKPTEKVVQAISNIFNNHKLGNISSKILNEQINKSWQT